MVRSALDPTMVMELLPLVPLGLLAGLLSGLLGVGGGLVFSPLLLLLGLTPHQALATSTLAIVPTTFGGTWSHLRTGRLAWREGIWIGLSAAGSGLLFSHLGNGLSGWHLLTIQAAMYGLLAFSIRTTQSEADSREQPQVAAIGLIAVGSVGGLGGGLLGLGGGLLMVPLMVRMLGVPIHQAIRLSTLAVLCSSSAASAEFLIGGRANASMAMLLGGSAAFSARWSAARLDRVSEQTLVWLLRLVTLLLAIDAGRRAISLGLSS
ncbi:sulfite exporter TauE/SafE family protein [Cyanobium sp. ULC084]